MQSSASSGIIVYGDNLDFLSSIDDKSIDLIYIDPPFNTGKQQSLTQLRTIRDEKSPDRIGFQGNGYRTKKLGRRAFSDAFDDFLGFLEPRISEAHRILKPNGAFFLHIDYREVHYCKVMLLDKIFGRNCFMNEIIWAYDYGARTKKKWSPKHDNLLWYVKDKDHYTYNYHDVDRIPYLAPGLVGPEKAKRGKTPTDTWWHTIVPTNGKEKTGYPTQKPIGIVNRIIRVHSNPNDLVLDFFAGSGTTGYSAAVHGRRYILVDNNKQAIEVMQKRLSFTSPKYIDLNNPKKPSRIEYRAQPQISSHSVNIIAVGVSDYKHMKNLPGTKEDLRTISRLFNSQFPTGLFDEDQIEILENPCLLDLRKRFSDFIESRSAKGDVLIFYFSGHGCVVKSEDFGFCLADTRPRPDGQYIPPINVLTFSDLVDSICSVDAIPIFIIDACFSGQTGKNPDDVLDKMQKKIEGTAGSSYTLACSCQSEDTVIDYPDGGLFTRTILSVAQRGRTDRHYRGQLALGLSDISHLIEQELVNQGHPIPKFYFGKHHVNFPLLRNTSCKPLIERFAPYMARIVNLLWNNGNPRELYINDFDKLLGKGAYANHSKLSYSPWNLLEDGSAQKSRRLTKQGKLFAQGKINIPEEMTKDLDTGEYVAVDGCSRATFSEVLEKSGYSTKRTKPSKPIKQSRSVRKKRR